jgi:hypothetical protein
MADWYYGENGEQKGPVDEATFRQWVAEGRIRPETLVWCDGMENWQAWSAVAAGSSGVPTAALGADPYQAPGAAGAPPYVVAPNSGFALASLICGLCSIVMMMTCLAGLLAAVPAVICGHLALKQIAEAQWPMAGRGMAITGLITGYLSIVATLLFVATIGLAFFSGL